jgi:hypothetical protein
MGLWVVDLLSDEQLTAAAERYHATIATTEQFLLVPLAGLHQQWFTHWQRCIRMPAGGAAAGGSMQTGFEMELIPRSAIDALMEGWPNFQEMRSRCSWEVWTIEQAGELLNFSGWGVQNGKPIPPSASHLQNHRGVHLVSPPITVSWQMRADKTTCVTVRAPLTIWTEENAMILPPTTTRGHPFM